MPRLIRTIEVISYRGEGTDRQYIYSVTKEYGDFSATVQRKYITKEEVEDHVKTGNWHSMTADREKSSVPQKMTVQITENFPINVPLRSFKDSTVHSGSEEFSGIIKPKK